MSDPILRPAATGWKADFTAYAMAHTAPVFRLFRNIWPIPHGFGYALVTRYDDVRSVFLNDPAFSVPYADNLGLIMGGERFFLGMGDTDEYRQDTAAMRAVMLPADLPGLAAAAATQADQILDAAGGRVEVVDFTRQVTFGVLCPYFGITPPPPDTGDLAVWATRLFEFQFTYGGKLDATGSPLLDDTKRMAPLLRAHIDRLIEARAASPGADDVLGRCLARRAAGETVYTDAKIRSALIGFLVGGLPQPPMVLPFALEQLLQRDTQLKRATAAATAGDVATVAAYMFEALRFDPLAPAIQRTCVQKTVLAPGAWYEATIPEGTTVLVSFASAMRDPRRVADPETFNIDRPDCDYMHFGYGLHRCFGEHINRAVLPAALERLLRRGARRAKSGGTLKKRGIFADTLWVEFS